jgi:hypothetical protein
MNRIFNRDLDLNMSPPNFADSLSEKARAKGLQRDDYLSRILKQALASPIYSALCSSCFSLNASSLYIFLLFIISSPYSCRYYLIGFVNGVYQTIELDSSDHEFTHNLG